MKTTTTTPHHTAMDGQEKENFSRFIQILGDTGNITHALTESGWSDQPQTTDGRDDAVDLSTMPRELLHDHVCDCVALPPAIQQYIDGCDAALTVNERHNIAIALEKHYNLAPVFCIIDHADGSFTLEHNHE